jgi:hypothetical protein
VKYTTYPVPPPEGCHWKVWEGRHSGYVYVELFENVDSWKPVSTKSFYPSKKQARNQKRIMDKMVVMVLDYQAYRERRESKTEALEGLLGKFK